MIKIGLIGEAPHDTNAMRNLLTKKYLPANYIFFELLRNIRGSMLDNQKTKSLLRREFQFERPDAIIFIRDLDGLLTDKEKFKERKDYFREFNSVVNKKGIFLLHIYELEALILTDIELFNKIYSTNHESIDDVSTIVDPKGFLKAKSRYNEGHNSDILNQISFDKTLRCRYFNDFLNRFDKYLENL